MPREIIDSNTFKCHIFLQPHTILCHKLGGITTNVAEPNNALAKRKIGRSTYRKNASGWPGWWVHPSERNTLKQASSPQFWKESAAVLVWNRKSNLNIKCRECPPVSVWLHGFQSTYALWRSCKKLFFKSGFILSRCTRIFPFLGVGYIMYTVIHWLYIN